MAILYKILFSVFFVVSTGSAKVLKIDISGADGQKPKDGECCEDLPKTKNLNQKPRQGDHAKPGTPGEHALDVDLQLKDTGGIKGHIVVYGTVYNQNGRPTSIINESIELNSTIFIDASGGIGARGGIGGKGQNGCEGVDGEDAEIGTKGTDGTRGCNSGGGGNASAAQDGGDGGNVRAYIPADQTHLALLVSADVSKGSGGDPGRVGQPGVPGKGGDGGKPLKYISHYIKPEPCEDSDTTTGSGNGSGSGNYIGSGGGSSIGSDDDSGGIGSGSGSGSSGGSSGGVEDLGNGYFRFESNATPYLREILDQSKRMAGDIFNELIGVNPAFACGGPDIPVYKTVEGGESKPDGEPGPKGKGDTSPGDDGDDGSFEFIVVEANGRETAYKRPFNLKLLSYRIWDDLPGGNNDGVFEPNEILTISNIRIKNTESMPSPRMADVVISIETKNWLIANPLDRVIVPSIMGNKEITLKDTFKVQVKNVFSVGQDQVWKVTDSIVSKGSIPRIKRTLEGLELPQSFEISFPVEITPIESVSVVGPGETASIQWKITNVSKSNFVGLNGSLRKLQTTLNRVGGNAPQNSIANFKFAGDENDSSSNFLKTIMELRPHVPIIISGEIDFSKDAEPYTYVDLQSTLGLEIFGTNQMSTIMTRSHRINISQTYKYTPGSSVLLLTHSKITRDEYKAWLDIFEDLGLKADVWDISYYKDLNLIEDLKAGQGKSLMRNYSGKTIVLLNDTETGYESLDTIRLLNRSQFYQSALEQNINFYILGGEKEFLAKQLVGMHLSPNNLEHTPAAKDDFIRQIEREGFDSNVFTMNNPDQLTYLEMHNSLKKHPESYHSLVFKREGGQTKLALYPSLSQMSGGMIAQPANMHEKSQPAFIRSEQNLRSFLLSLGFEDKIKSYSVILKSGNQLYLPLISSAIMHDLIEFSYAYSKSSAKKSEFLGKLNAFKDTLNISEVHPRSKDQLGRVIAAISYFANISSEVGLQDVSNKLISKLDGTTKTSHEKYLESYRQFSSKREAVLKVNFDKVFDTYKMFTLPAIGRAITSGNTLFIKSSRALTGDLK